MRAREILDIALDLINERAENGEFTRDLLDHERRAPNLLTILCISLYELDCRMKDVRCNFDDMTPSAVTSLEDEIGLDERVCRTALPYGLAFLLLNEEEPQRAALFKAEYDRTVWRLEKQFTKGKRKRITEVY